MVENGASTSTAAAADTVMRSEFAIAARTRHLARFARRKPLGAACGLILLLVCATSIAADITAPYSPTEAIAGERLSSPTASHLLGTDNASRDVFSRVVWGGRNSLAIGFAAVAVGILGAVSIGTLSGYFGGWLDALLQRLTDAMMAIPGLLLVMVVISMIGTGRLPVTGAIAVGLMFPGSRVVRSAVLGVTIQPYVEAALATGASVPRVILRHVLPNIVAPVIIIATINLGAAIVIEASLSFLGLGVPPPNPTWGQMLGGQTRTYMLEAPWMALGPGLALTLVVFSFNILGDALRDVLDPRLRV